MTFEKPDFKKFPCLQMAYDAGKKGGSAPIVLNAANEVAVNDFLTGKISFLDIEKTVEKALCEHSTIYNLSLDDIFEIDNEIRKKYSA